MSVVARAWRWFTLADAPTMQAERVGDPVRGCQFCGDQVECLISVGAPDRLREWRTCSPHLGNVLAELEARKR
jgi:hypothetical protein